MEHLWRKLVILLVLYVAEEMSLGYLFQVFWPLRTGRRGCDVRMSSILLAGKILNLLVEDMDVMR